MLKEILIGVAAALIFFFVLRGFDVTPLLLLGGLVVIFYFILNERGAGRRFELTAAAKEGGSSTQITFDDIGGQEVAKRELLEALQFVRDTEAVGHLGIRPLRGILLVGPPGTGKTLLAKAAANFVGASFVTVSGSQFVEMYAGVGAQRVRQLFKRARELATQQRREYAIIFIDEIEVLGSKRGQHHGHLEYDQTLNELLVQMDGLQTTQENVRILVVAATNRPDLLDSALMRPGRFDRTVQVDLPDKEGRLHILRIHCKGRPLHPDVNLEAIAKETYGFSGAHLESLVNEAAILALRDDAQVIEPKHFKEGIEKVMMGEELDRSPTEEERERIAYHETGHALLSEMVRPGSVASVTITSRGRALGYMRQTPADEMYLFTKQDLLDQIAVALAGAVSEEIFFGCRSTGSVGDFEQAIHLAERIIEAGLSSLGIVNPDTLSPQVRNEEVTRILAAQEAYVQRQIAAFEERVRKVACRLIEEERLSGDEFRGLVGELRAVQMEDSASATASATA